LLTPRVSEGENLWNKILAEDGDSYEALQKLYTMLSERDPSFKETLQRAMDEGQIAKWVLQGKKAKPDAVLY